MQPTILQSQFDRSKHEQAMKQAENKAAKDAQNNSTEEQEPDPNRLMRPIVIKNGVNEIDAPTLKEV